MNKYSDAEANRRDRAASASDWETVGMDFRAAGIANDHLIHLPVDVVATLDRLRERRQQTPNRRARSLGQSMLSAFKLF